jgi:plasmid stability protein
MGQILIRGIEDHVLVEFKERARSHGRSQEQEARMLIEEAAREHRALREFLAFARRNLRELRREDADYGEAATEIRADRGR